MTKLSKAALFTVIAVAAAGAVPALADSIGAPGRIVGIEHNDNDSDDAGTYTGRMFVDVGGGTIEPYYFGGVLCSGRDLTIDQQRVLLDQMHTKKGVVLPYYKVGQAAVHCLVSFGLATSSKTAPLVSK